MFNQPIENHELESSDVVVFDLGRLLQGVMRVAKLKKCLQLTYY